MAAAAVVIVVAAVAALHALVRTAGQPGRPASPGAPPASVATRSSASPSPSALGGGELTVTQKYTITAPVGSLVVNDAVGAVSVAAGSGSGISVTAKIYYRATAPSVSRTVSGRTLTLGYSSCTDCGVAFTVTVPRATSATINAHAGKVDVAGLAGRVSVSDDAGAVALTQLAGDVSVRDGTGAISGTGLTSAHASFRDGTGMIGVVFAAPPHQLSAVSSTGMVSIRVPPGVTYRVDASSRLGMVNDSLPQSPAATHLITATAGTGVVSLSTG